MLQRLSLYEKLYQDDFHKNVIVAKLMSVLRSAGLIDSNTTYGLIGSRDRTRALRFSFYYNLCCKVSYEFYAHLFDPCQNSQACALRTKP